MKKILIITAAAILSLCSYAQKHVEFLGMELAQQTKAGVAKELLEKGYVKTGEQDGYEMFKGKFLNMDASVLLVPEGSTGITAVNVSIKNVNPTKSGKLYGELLQKFMEKYSGYKYTLDNSKPNSSVKSMFTNKLDNGLSEAVILDIKIKSGTTDLDITYIAAIKISDDDTQEKGESVSGITMDEI